MHPTPTEIRQLLNRAEHALGQDDATLLAALFEDMSSPEVAIMRRVEIMAQAQTDTNRLLAAATKVLEHDAASRDRETLALEAQTQALNMQAEHAHERHMVKLREIVVPFVTGLVSALTTYLSLALYQGQTP